MSDGGVTVDEGFQDLNDQDILNIEGVLNFLQEKYSQKAVLLDDFPREAKERFHNAGYRVRVDMYDSNVSGVYVPEITIQGRVEGEGEFDPEQMAWETTRDVLEIGEGGVIQSDGSVKDPKQKLILPKKG